MKAYGKKVWLIPDTFLNSVSKNGSISHEAICVINTSDVDADIKLTDYRVRVLNSGKATASVVRVVIETTDGKRTWRTTGASHDIIDASWQALSDSMVYFLEKQRIH